MNSRYESNESLIEYIDTLKSYEGYVQFSDEALRKCDVFEGLQDIKLTPTKGFVYEAHFSNGQNSIMIRQQNAEWVVSETIISDVDEKDMEYFALEKTTLLTNVKSNWVKMAQIWKNEEDKLCELEKDGKTIKGMQVMKLKKVVFAGFSVDKKKGEK